MRKSNKLKIGIDLDDTVCQVSIAIENYVKLNRPDKKHLFNKYYLRKNFKIDSEIHNQLIAEALNSKNFFLNLEPYPNAVEQILNLSKSFTVYFCSSAGDFKYAASEKMQWVARYFDSTWLNRLVITPAKDIIDVDILIDDRVDNAHHFLTQPKWQQILFKQSWNSNLSLPKIDGWIQAEEVINTTIKLKGL